MFPTLDSLTEYLFGVSIGIPVKTFGLFAALAFVASYFVFLSEFKRKENNGSIQPFCKVITAGKGASWSDYLNYAFLGGIIGLKVVGAIIYRHEFSAAPLGFIFSVKGSWLSATILAAVFSFFIYRYKNAGKLTVPLQKTELVHPWQLMPKLILWAAVWGFLGAKIFNFFENIHLYTSWQQFRNYSGLTFYGGLVFGALSYLYIGYKNGIKLVHLADIGSPGMLTAYGVGRIGCHLSGDGDWGIVNNYTKPLEWLPDWIWSFRFPHNVINKGEYIQGCIGNYCSVLPQGVFPTSFYESAIILSCFCLLWVNRKRIRTPGLMFCLYLLIVGAERFLIEEIRVNYQYQVLQWRLSQAQIISLLFIAGGIGGLFMLYRRTI